MKVSIIIPTYNHCDDFLKPCIESVIKYTDMTDKELIVVANGCTDNTKEYLISLSEDERIPHYSWTWFDEATGAPKALNEGIMAAQGEYVLLLNNDVVFLKQKKDALIKMHLDEFKKDEKVGIVGPIISHCVPIDRDFIIFFCAMIPKKLFEEIGLLDEAFSPGAGEDVDFCVKAQRSGYKIAIAGAINDTRPGLYIGSVPIWHKGEGTVHDESLVKDWKKTFNRNAEILAKRYPPHPILEVKEKKRVLCAIPTKNRYFTTLPLAIESVIQQTVKPDRLIIYDDGDHTDLRNHATYRYLFRTLDSVGINWNVEFTAGGGQHKAHQKANTEGYELVWRLDDDTVAEPDVLQKLLWHMNDGVGAVAGSVITPGEEANSQWFAKKLFEIHFGPNIQWKRGRGVHEVEHLYSSFLYRAGIVNYNLDLSEVAHREETMFSHSIFLKGYKLLVDRSITTWHYRNPEGGIRTKKDPKLWEHDEEVFRRQIDKWGYKLVANSHGLGDHFAFVNVIPKLLEKYRKLIIFCMFPDAFDNIKNIDVYPLGMAEKWGVKNVGLYEWCTLNNWKRSIVEAYEKMYLD
jgi:GT2 family glycosyltransferase